MSLRPRSLPKVRDQVVRHFDDPASWLRTTVGEANQRGLEAAANHLRAAELYWVAPDMTALAASAGGSLAAARWATADRPAPCGLIVFDQGIGHIDALGVEIPVHAISWGPNHDACTVGLFVSRWAVKERINPRMELVTEAVPPLLPAVSYDLPVTGEPVPLAELPAGAPHPVMAALAASWLLMQQPQLVDRQVERPDKPTARSYARAGRESPNVTVVDLRRQYVPDTADPDGDGPSRRYRNRWVVSGHWRNQAHGPDRSLRRQTWIPAFVKGPEGAPLLATERVNVWRR